MYSNGATTEAGECRKASVTKCWPPAPTSPMPASQGQCSGRTGTQELIASTPAPSATSAMTQKTMLSVVSVRVSTRTEITLTE